MDKSGAISNHKICTLFFTRFFFVFLQHIKMSNPREIERQKEIENIKTVIERHEKVIEKLKMEGRNKIKELK